MFNKIFSVLTDVSGDPNGQFHRLAAAQILMIIMMAIFSQITSKEKKTFYQMITPSNLQF